jgi:glycolate oxidase FAD binding subunit
MDYAAVLGADPGEVARPASVEEVAEVVARANEAKKAVVPWGGGTAQAYGYAPRRVDVLLDLTGLDRVVALEPGDLTATVEAGVTMAALQGALAEHGQYLPLDPPHADTATAGGVLATDAFGPARVGHGTARDWLIGITVVDALGRVVRGGGKVVKNVTGYDLPKLHVGALGTLGVIVEATFKVAPRPEASRALLLDLSGPGDDVLLVNGLLDRTDPTLCLLHEEAGPSVKDGSRYLFVVYRGQEEVVEHHAATFASLARDAGAPAPRAIEDEVAPADPSPDETIIRFAAPPGESLRLHDAVAAEGAAASLRTLPGVSRVDAHCDTEDAALALLAWARREMQPYAVLQAPLSLRTREALDLWRPLPPSFPLMQRLKSALDPNATLNPGRYVGRI